MFSIGRQFFKDMEEMVSAINYANKKFPPKLEKAMNDIADIAIKHIEINYNSEGKYFGKPWKPLKKSTQAQRLRKGYNPTTPILVRRGRLRASVVSKNSVNHRRIVTKKGISVRSAAKTKSGLNLFDIHQKGTRRIPARKIVREGNPPWINDQGWKEIQTRLVGMFLEVRREMMK